MNGKALIPLVAGLAIGGFALWMGFNTLKNARGAPQPVEKVKVWYADTDIPRGVEIGEEMVKLVAFPVKLMPEGVLREEDEIIGRVPRINAVAGLPLLDHMLLAPGERAGVRPKPGFRAVAVKIDEASGVDYHLEPGCFVDVVGSFTVRRSGRSDTLARTIVENVEVAAVGARLSAVQSAEDEDKSTKRAVRAVTLFVKPDDVPKLLLAEQKGRIKLSLRNDEDLGELQADNQVSTDELTGEEAPAEEVADSGSGEPSLLDKLRGVFAAPQPEAEPAEPAAVAVAPAPEPEPVKVAVTPPWSVVVYRGHDMQTVNFKNKESRELYVEPEATGDNSNARKSRRRTLGRSPIPQVGGGEATPKQSRGEEPDQEPKEFQE